MKSMVAWVLIMVLPLCDSRGLILLILKKKKKTNDCYGLLVIRISWELNGGKYIYMYMHMYVYKTHLFLFLCIHPDHGYFENTTTLYLW